jgi:hypothetical protein
MTWFLKIRRRLALKECTRRLAEFEEMAQMPFNELEAGLYSGKVNRGSHGIYGIYEEWSRLLDAYSAYIENGEFDFTIEEVPKITRRAANNILSEKRLELLSFLGRNKVGSINELARSLHRDVKNVYIDLLKLSRAGFVDLAKDKRSRVVPECRIEEVSIVLTG